MRDQFLTVDGLVVPPAALELPRARALAAFSGGGATPYVRLIECYRQTGEVGAGNIETVVVELDVERPQAPVHDIRRVERIAISIRAVEGYPEVLALRADFPRVPHLNLTGREFPRSLCLYDRPWIEFAVRWTPAVFVERIRDWLKLTARGMLHQEDQPLEQLLFDLGLRILLPADLVEDLEGEKPVELDIARIQNPDHTRNLVAVKPTGNQREKSPPQFVATTFIARPQTHGIIRETPSNLGKLHEFLVSGGIDLVAELRRRLRDWEKSEARAAKLVIIVAFPLKRTAEGPTEQWDFWVFGTISSVREVGVAIGLWVEAGEHVALLLELDDSKRGQDLPVLALAPYFGFTRESAADANGVSPDPMNVVAIGTGALGSQVIATLAREGFGSWTLVDDDDLLPHNLARHALYGEMVGHPKARGLAYYLNTLYMDAAPAEAIVADVLMPKDKKEALDEKYAAADLILDAAASVPVARHLALDIQSSARRVSVFLNPHGTDLVVLAEDRHRKVPLDLLEAQYYRAAASHPELIDHLGLAPGRLRYGRTCRDITTTMATHLVSLHAAIASQAVRNALLSENASIRVWRCDPKTLAITLVEVEPTSAERGALGDWTLVIDNDVLTQLAALREEKLPNETGGVLIGAYDLTRRIVYVVDTVQSPPDSAEWPTLYIRGKEGLLDRIREIGTRSGGQLEYIGEWHSHPSGCPPNPSADDLTVFAWLTEHMDHAGLPALMAIVSDGGASNWFLTEVHSDFTLRCELEKNDDRRDH